MIASFTNLARNLAAGARLALALPASRLSFRVDVAQLLLVFAFSTLIDIAGDWLRYGPDGEFSLYGAGNEFYTLGLLIVVSALVALAQRRHALVLALPVIVLSSAPVIQLADLALVLAVRSDEVAPYVFARLAYLVPVWFIAMIIRAVWIAAEGDGRRRFLHAVLGGAVVAAPVWLSSELLPPLYWWERASASDDKPTSAASPAFELVQAAQTQLLDDALAALEDSRPGTSDLYFVGFAADARADAYRDDVIRARETMDERWDTRGRSITLVNHRDTLLEHPFATLTNLRETLREIAGAMDTEKDVVMLYLAGPGNGDGVEVSHAPLDLFPITPAVLRALLDDAGIKHRIIVVSACRSGQFQRALADESTVVLTATGGDAESAACKPVDGGTAFGEALFAKAFAENESFERALRAAVRALGGRDNGEAGDAPALSIGTSVAPLLKELHRGSGGQRGHSA
jgi:peptidase C13-like protein